MILTTITWIFVVVLFFPIFAHCGTTLSRIVEFQAIWSWKKITLILLKSLIKDWYYFLKKLFRGAVFICEIRYIDMWKSIIPLFVSTFSDMGRAMIALFITAFFFMFVSFITGVVGCWRTSPSNINGSAILMLIACKFSL